MADETIGMDDVLRVDIRAGTIITADPFPEAREPAYKLVIDFGPTLGRKTSSAQITDHYSPEMLVGRQVAAIVNLPPRQVGPFRSQVLVLGFSAAQGGIHLIAPDRPVPNGARLH